MLLSLMCLQQAEPVKYSPTGESILFDAHWGTWGEASACQEGFATKVHFLALLLRWSQFWVIPIEQVSLLFSCCNDFLFEFRLFLDFSSCSLIFSSNCKLNHFKTQEMTQHWTLFAWSAPMGKKSAATGDSGVPGVRVRSAVEDSQLLITSWSLSPQETILQAMTSNSTANLMRLSSRCQRYQSQDGGTG